ncbi:MAG: hypothetical protein KC591_07735, partial [Gemmatimonadetes bacterium]|nr:hypothetical protein [Gemmatimonadota bacterium]
MKVHASARSFRAAALIAGMAIASPAFANGDDRPETIELVGTVRDFHERSHSPGGHTDFEKRPGGGFGHYVNMVEEQLGEDGKPVYRSQGYKMSSQWKDANGRQVGPSCSYIASRSGDRAGWASGSEGNCVTNEESFHSWFRDVAGTNTSISLPITLVRQGDTDTYVFDDRNDPNLVG